MTITLTPHTGGDFGGGAPQRMEGQAPQAALHADDDELAKLLLTPSPPPAEPPA